MKNRFLAFGILGLALTLANCSNNSSSEDNGTDATYAEVLSNVSNTVIINTYND